jgi:hypothetical protein
MLSVRERHHLIGDHGLPVLSGAKQGIFASNCRRYLNRAILAESEGADEHS